MPVALLRREGCHVNRKRVERPIPGRPIVAATATLAQAAEPSTHSAPGARDGESAMANSAMVDASRVYGLCEGLSGDTAECGRAEDIYLTCYLM
jgi:hypothetical protein